MNKIYKILLIFSCLLLMGCDSASEKRTENDANEKDMVVDNEPILGCNIPTIDKYNSCNVYFEDGLVYKIEFVSTYPNKEEVDKKKEELENVFGSVDTQDLTIFFEINKDNDKYMEYIGMDKVSIGYICR